MSESVEERMKRDGRTLDHKTLKEIRRMAVQRVREGEKPSVVIAIIWLQPPGDLQMAQGCGGTRPRLAGCARPVVMGARAV